MVSRVLVVAALLGCAHAQPTQTIVVPARPTLSTPPDGQDADVDGDGTPDRIVTGFSDVTIYVRRGAGFVLFTKIDAEGHVAFVHVVDKGTGVRDLSIDTWLYHGDRKRTTWSWVGGWYVAGLEEEIRGPRH